MNNLKESIVSEDILHKYLNKKAENHNYYKFYANRTKVEGVINNHALFLSNGNSWNDVIDKNSFNPNESNKVRFGLCLSFTRTENVAMWKLYADGEGMMIDFSSNIIKYCLKQERISCGRFSNGNFISQKELSRDRFEIEMVDMLYYGEPKDNDANSFYIKRADEVIRNCPRDIIERAGYYKKWLPWQYECECRLIITIDKQLVKNCNTVKIPFGESLIEELTANVYHAPNYKGVFIYNESSLKGKVDWE